EKGKKTSRRVTRLSRRPDRGCSTVREIKVSGQAAEADTVHVKAINQLAACTGLAADEHGLPAILNRDDIGDGAGVVDGRANAQGRDDIAYRYGLPRSDHHFQIVSGLGEDAPSQPDDHEAAEYEPTMEQSRESVATSVRNGLRPTSRRAGGRGAPGQHVRGQ